jgi:ribonucleoside-diphosphate reductase alpha chain
MRFISERALQASRELARERGLFPNWKGSVYQTKQIEVRNATRTAVAPTGTISIIAATSASIEPLFALAYRRSHVLRDETLYEVNPILVKHLERHGMDVEKALERIEEEGHIRNVEDLPEEIRRLFVTALDIAPERHLQIQAAFQRHVDNSVSKTINLPATATPGEIARAYRLAWEWRLKGVTIYRYGSKSKQVLELGVDEEAFYYDHSSSCDPRECKI